jgi:EmrB/QacA subfamily drug resistance transporter
VPDKPSNTTAPQHQRAAWWTVAVVTVATFMLMLDLTVVNVALPRLRESLHAGFSDLQWVLDAYALTLASCLLTAGSLADRIGRRRVFCAGFILFSAASLACGLAPNITALIGARAAQGVGAAILFAVGPALIGAAVHGKARAAAFGVFGAGAGLAIATGPLIGGALTSGPGWRWIFLINVPIGAAACLAGLVRMRESIARHTHRADWAGFTTFTAGLTALVFALLRGSTQGWTSPAILATGLAGLACLIAFTLVERAKADAAMLDLALFRNPTYTGLALITVLISSACMSAVFLLISYVQNELGYNPWQTGLRFLPMTLILFLSAALGGALTAKVPHRLLLALSCAAPAAGLALVQPMLHTDSTWTALLPCTLGLGLGLGVFNPVRAYLAIGVVAPEKAAAASGMSETFGQAGMALGIAALGALYQDQATRAFTATSVGRQVTAFTPNIGQALASGALPPTPASPAGDTPDAIAETLRSSLITGLHDALTISALLCAIGVLIALPMIRRVDLHPSALGAMPGVLPDLDQDEPEPTALDVGPGPA